MSKKACIVICCILLVWVFGFFAANLILPDKSFSDMENRYLSKMPKFSFESLKEGEFTADFETYLNDQFAGRDFFIKVNTAFEYLSGKKESGGTLFGKEDTLIQGLGSVDEEKLGKTMGYIQRFRDKVDFPVYVGFIPGSADIWSDRLAYGTPNVDQEALIDSFYGLLGDKDTIDIHGALEAHADEDIFYRTDHHWTSLGAYYAYCALGESLGFEPVPLAEYEETAVTNEFYGTQYSKAPGFWIEPDTIHTYVPEDGVSVTVFDGTSEIEKELYCEEKLETKDKYTFFLGGNQPLIQVKTENKEAPKLLILRDSFTDSLTPFLTAHYSEIHLLDARYYKQSVEAYVEEHDIDQVLILYSVAVLDSDSSNLAFLLSL